MIIVEDYEAIQARDTFLSLSESPTASVSDSSKKNSNPWQSRLKQAN